MIIQLSLIMIMIMNYILNRNIYYKKIKYYFHLLIKKFYI